MSGTRVFVKIENYGDVIDIIGLIKEKIGESRDVLARLEELKNQEDSELDIWNNTLENIKNRVDYIDNVLFQENI